jgi:hypothetical protein
MQRVCLHVCLSSFVRVLVCFSLPARLYTLRGLLANGTAAHTPSDIPYLKPTLVGVGVCGIVLRNVKIRPPGECVFPSAFAWRVALSTG